jgi:hypothetical protein
MPRRQCGSTCRRKPASNLHRHSLRGGVEQSQSGNEIETFQGGNESVNGNPLTQTLLTCYPKIILRLETRAHIATRFAKREAHQSPPPRILWLLEPLPGLDYSDTPHLPINAPGDTRGRIHTAIQQCPSFLHC